MFKRICSILFAGTLVTLAPAYSAPNSVSNVKKIVKKNGKIYVIIRENGKDKELILSEKDINKINSGKNSKKSSKKVVKKSSKKSIKTIKEVLKSSKKSKKIVKKDKKTTKKSKRVATYKITSGDTLFSIARKYKVSIADLVKLNHIGSKKPLHPDDILKIPTKGYVEASKEAVAKNNKTVYKVKSGDTLSVIAKKFNMSLKKLKSLNNLRGNKLKKGMELTVIGRAKSNKKPESKALTKNGKYIIKRGDTVWNIAKRFNLTPAQLRLLNPSIKRKGLRKGMAIWVSKTRAKRLSSLARKRSNRLKGLLSRYTQRGSRYSRRGSRNVVSYAKRFLGTRYIWGATGRGGFDCSGFTQYVMRHAKGRSIPRVSRRQAYYGRYISRRNLRPGDLIFFDTSHRRRGYVNHVGIYIGNGRFIHASSAKHRVVITSLNKPFYRSRFMWGRRVN